MKKREQTPVFKEYTMGQMMLLPVNIEELIPENHLVRVIHHYVEQLDMKAFMKRYKGGGTSSCHPKMMLKIYLYAYTQKLYTSRRIAKALRENVAFMWLSGNNRPDFRTINRFRGERLKGIIEEIFGGLLILLIEEGYIKLEDYFVDGTKVEANANVYSYVWAKSNQHYQERLREKVKKLFEEIEAINREEDAHYGDQDLEEMGGEKPIAQEKVAQQAAKMNEQLQQGKQGEKSEENDKQGKPAKGGDKEAGKISEQMEEKLMELKEQQEDNPENKALAKAIRTIEKDYLPRAQKYERQQEILNGRNSYSKTDPDAIFMRMKDDHLGNGQLKAGYNIQNGIEKQFVVNFSIHQKAGDLTCFIPHMKQLQQQTGGRLPERVGSDAAYGNEENYAYLEKEDQAIISSSRALTKNRKNVIALILFRQTRCLMISARCIYLSEWETTALPKNREKTTSNGYPTERSIYVCQDCQDCPMREKCTRSKNNNRQIQVSFPLRKFREQARENLLSPDGLRLRSQRSVDVKTVFGRIKENWGVRRFLLRGLDKVTIEWGLLCMAHNLSKVWSSQNEIKLVTL